MMIRYLPIILGLFFLSFPRPTSAQSSDELLVGPIEYQQNVNGIPVTIKTRSYLSILTSGGRIELKSRVVANLADLQRRIGSIVDTFNLPRENCRSFSGNNPVVSLPKKDLLFKDGGAALVIGGSVTMWDCRENPIPNSKVEWEMKQIGPIKTKVPVVKTWPGDPIKHMLATQDFDAGLPISLAKTDSFSVALRVGRPEIELKGNLAFIAKGILTIAGVDINQKAHDALQKAIDPKKLQLTLPTEIRQFNPSVEDARFVDDSGQLGAELRLAAQIPASALTSWLKELMEKKKP